MKIVLLGPISTSGIAPLLSEEPPANFPVGYTGAPFMNTLIAELLAKGYEVYAITAGGYEATRSSKPLSLKGDRFEFYCCPHRKHSIRLSAGHVGRIVDFYAYERRAMKEVLEKIQPDFIHAHWTYEFAMTAIDSGIPYLVTAHDDPAEVLRLYKNVYRFGRYVMARKVLSSATAITAVSDDLRRRIAPLTRTEINVIPNPLSRQFTDSDKPSTHFFKNTTPKLISVVNGWGYLKNVSSALIAFAQIRRHIKNVTYHLYGLDFQPGGPAERWAKSENLSEGVVFHGAVTHSTLVNGIKEAALMLHPSRSESCPMGIAEAMALGLPVVGGESSGGVPWMIGEAGILVDITKPEAIAQAAIMLLTNTHLYDKCVEAAKQRVKEFSPDAVVAQYEVIYQQVLNQASKQQ